MRKVHHEERHWETGVNKVCKFIPNLPKFDERKKKNRKEKDKLRLMFSQMVGKFQVV